MRSLSTKIYALIKIFAQKFIISIFYHAQIANYLDNLQNYSYE